MARLVAALNSSRFDGAIFPSLPGIMPQLGQFVGRIVLMGPRIGPVAAIDVDHIGGARAGLNYLAGLGHRRIGYLWPGLDGGRRRHSTYLREMESINPGEPPLDIACSWSVDDARLAALSLLRRPRRPTAILCADEVMAAGVYKAARFIDLAIPHDLSILAFMDTAAPRMLDPELSTIDMPLTALGALATEVMLKQLGGAPVPEPILLPMTLTPRSSTATAPEP